jgi:hypothetical protein
VVVGAAVTLVASAAGLNLGFEGEKGTLAGCATSVTDNSASGTKAVKFGTGTGCSDDPGAILPINYNLASLSGTLRYVSTTGNDATGNGTVGAPYATISRAVTAASSGDNIVIRGGTYRPGYQSLSSSKTLKFIAYPGEIPVFNGARAVTGGWVTEGSYRYIPYTPQPVTDGSGISFTTGQNLTGDGIGKHPDQAWIGTTQLRQVSAKASVVNGRFWVDEVNARLYLTSTDAAQSGIEVSDKDKFLAINAPNTLLEGIRITRYSNSANDYGVINIAGTADGTTLRNVEMSESAFSTIGFNGDSNLLANGKLEHVTLTTGNWMGLGAMYTDDFVADKVKITNMNQFGEFTSSPQSGGVKTSRTHRTKILNSEISNNANHGLWFDQSNYDTQLYNNQIVNNGGSAVFFEISDRLTMVDNYVVATGSAQALRLAGSSGLRLVNNTFVGGGAPLGVYTDNRSIPGCSDPAEPLCEDSYSSDRDTVRPHLDTMDWIPRIDLFINNIIAYPTAASYCGSVTPFCITGNNAGAIVTLDQIIHHADATRGIPQTVIDGNVYANGSSRIIVTPTATYTTLGAFTTAMAGSPVSISGLEANGKYGNTFVSADGTPTASLAHTEAVPVPIDSTINQYITAGTRHFGVTYK